MPELLIPTSRRSMLERPETFTLDYSHPLANGLVFAGLGRIRGTQHYSDSSPYGNHGTLTNMDPATDWVWDTTLNRWRVDFSGTSQNVLLTSAVALGTAHSCSFWVKTSGVNWMNFTNSLNYLFYNGAGTWYYKATTYVAVTGVAFSSSVWKHIAVTRNGNSVKFFADAVQIGATQTLSGAGNGSCLYLASRYDDQYELPGFLADNLVWTKELSLSEIQQLADPSNVMLSGLILPPRRRLWAVPAGAPVTKKIPVWMRQYRQRWGA